MFQSIFKDTRKDYGTYSRSNQPLFVSRRGKERDGRRAPLRSIKYGAWPPRGIALTGSGLPYYSVLVGTPSMATVKSTTVRYYYIDNLRTMVIMLVICCIWP